MRARVDFLLPLIVAALASASPMAAAGARTTFATELRIMPPDGAVFAVGQRFDLRVEARSGTASRPDGLRVTINGRDLTAKNDPQAGNGAPADAATLLLRGFSLETAGSFVVRAVTADGASAEVRLSAQSWNTARAGVPRARNIIVLLGDGMGIAHRTAARIASRGVRNGKAAGRLAMDTLEVTGMVMTGSLNSVITDSSPGMSAYVTGQKANNNQEGVFPDNTADAFDNPRVEYLGEMLRRTRGSGFNVGIVTTADVTDSTPAANAVHTSDRYPEQASRPSSSTNVSGTASPCCLEAARRNFRAAGRPAARATDGRQLADEFTRAGYAYARTGRTCGRC